MDAGKEFLETSTIHGLSYISKSKKYAIKLLWIFIIAGGFGTAGYIIADSFNAWGKYPVSTTIETLPISKAMFPVINVCPPEHTYTTMNYDLVQADNTTLDKNVRDDLGRLYSDWEQDEQFALKLETENSFKEKNDYSNWYLGYSYRKKQVLETGTGDRYIIYTSATAGSLSTHWFGQFLGH